MSASLAPPAVSIVIPVRNDARRLRRCLETLREAASGAVFEIIVADNGSTDDSARVAAEAGAIVVPLPDRRVAQVRNEAAARARGEYLAFVDADHELDPGWSHAAMRALSDPAIDAAGAQYYAPADGTWVQRAYDRLRRHRSGDHAVGWLPSGNLIIRRAAFERLGGFDAALETCEDVDLCQRLTAGGGRIMAVEGMRSVHLGDPATLAALFGGELWRGRDNLRVSLRVPLTFRSTPSVAFPIVTLLAM
ncbi:MAG TPA: glycosyltransferase, partial [Vicinamibacterales bacterium]|nr:glycosyltransferase [Vicinamibacterales bacterium]